jgi:hypothetical protein
MTTQISGDAGCSAAQPGSITQSDLAANVAGTGPAFSAYLTTTISTAGAFDHAVFQSQDFAAVGGGWDATGSIFTPTVAGYYQFNCGMLAIGSSGANFGEIQLWKNGSAVKATGFRAMDSTYIQGGLSALVYMNGSSDSIKMYYKASGTSMLVQAGSTKSFFQGFLARAA